MSTSKVVIGNISGSTVAIGPNATAVNGTAITGDDGDDAGED